MRAILGKSRRKYKDEENTMPTRRAVIYARSAVPDPADPGALKHQITSRPILHSEKEMGVGLRLPGCGEWA